MREMETRGRTAEVKFRSSNTKVVRFTYYDPIYFSMSVSINYAIHCLHVSANVSKQILEKSMLRHYRPHGRCRPRPKPIKPSKGKETRIRDDLVYTFGHDKIHRIFRVEEVVDNEYRCHEYATRDHYFEEQATLNFGLTGVLRRLTMLSGIVHLTAAEIKGKVISTEGLFYTASNNVLCQK